ncbi:MAG: hypothetical protein WC773_03645 [Patescibacteria group bacterium]
MPDETENQQPAPKKSGRKILMIILGVAAIAIPLIMFGVIFAVFYNPSGTWNKPTGNSTVAGGTVNVGPDCNAVTLKEATTYVPGKGGIEGGVNDARGVVVHKLEDYLNGKYSSAKEGNYAGLAANLETLKGSTNTYKYGTKAYIPDLEKKAGVAAKLNGKGIEFRIVDTGAFSEFGNNPFHFDIATSDSSYINSTNGDLGDLNVSGATIYVGNGCTRDNFASPLPSLSGS